MYEQVKKPKENKSRAVANSLSQRKGGEQQGFGFVDNLRKVVSIRKSQDIANNISTPAIQGVFTVVTAGDNRVDIDDVDTIAALTRIWAELKPSERQNGNVKRNFVRRYEEILDKLHSGALGKIRSAAGKASAVVSSITTAASEVVDDPIAYLSASAEELTPLLGQRGISRETSWNEQRDSALALGITSAASFCLGHAVETVVGEAIPGAGAVVEGLKQTASAAMIEERRKGLQDGRNGYESLSDVVKGPEKVRQAQQYLINWRLANGVSSAITKGTGAAIGAGVALLTTPVLGPFAVVAGATVGAVTGKGTKKGAESIMLSKAKENGKQAAQYLDALAYQHPTLSLTSTVPWSQVASYGSTSTTSTSVGGQLPEGVDAAQEALYVITGWNFDTLISMTETVALHRIVTILGL